jgi:drug/metabolite transporter (DMT)-like permease
MLNKERQLNYIGLALLMVATLIWGTSFIILKNTLESLPVMFVLAVRFTISAIILFIVFHKRFIGISKKTVTTGLILGVILATAYLLQTYGLKGVSPGENAFLTSTYSVMVPFMCWALFRRKPDVYSIIAGVLCVGGIGLVAFTDGAGLTVGLGQILTLVCAIFYGLQIIVISIKGEKEDPMVILCIQLAVVGAVCLVGTLGFEVGRQPISLDLGLVLTLVYLTFMCTLTAQGCQIVGQKFVPTSQASIILSLESVFGLLFSAILGGESFTPISITGFALIFISVIISETKLKFITNIFRKKERVNTND